MSEVCIVYSGDLGEPGGGTDRVSAFAKGLSDSGYDVTLVIAKPTGQLPERIRHVETVHVPLESKGVTNQLQRALLLVRRAKSISRERNALLQIIHSPLAGIFSVFDCEGYVLDMHDLVYQSPLYRKIPFSGRLQDVIANIERRGTQSASKIVVVSEYMKRHLVTEWDIPSNKIAVIPNGYFKSIQNSHLIPYPQRVRGRVVFLGMLHPKVDLDAIRRVAHLETVEEVIVIGDGPKYDALRSGDIPNVSLAGRIPDPIAFDLVSRAELAINPQRESVLQKASSPVKIFLYAGLGIPAVATAGPDIVSEYDRADALSMVEPGAGEFAQQVDQLMSDADRRQTMSQNAIDAAETHDWASRSEALVSVFD